MGIYVALFGIFAFALAVVCLVKIVKTWTKLSKLEKN